MSLRCFTTPDGYFANLFGHHGCIEATVHRPEASGRKKWRLCFAQCTGAAHALRGKVYDFPTLGLLKAELSGFDRLLNAEARPDLTSKNLSPSFTVAEVTA